MAAVANAESPAASQQLTILYDERCEVCRRARDWLLTQPCLVPVELLPAGSDEAHRRYGGLPWLGEELVAVDEYGNAWIGPAAFLASMWATARYRPWAFRLSRPGLSQHAERFFNWISKKRTTWSTMLSPQDNECTWCKGTRAKVFTGVCANNHLMVEGQRYCRECGSPRVVLQHQL
ncbi:MAG: thiol-disulfide oxidoreductase DCC family protein [Actinomycetota bacterium]|nr:DUF393 domain-containing protein [Actinomycetota bacterium]